MMGGGLRLCFEWVAVLAGDFYLFLFLFLFLVSFFFLPWELGWKCVSIHHLSSLFLKFSTRE